MNKSLLIIVTRNPELGKVKTRLAKTIGDQAALDIYNSLLNHTMKITENLEIDKVVYYSENIGQNDIWNPSIYQKKLQVGKDLGERIEDAFRFAFKKGYQKVAIIGSDMHDIKSEHIMEAFEELETNEIVIGPAEDGGYYLLGMSKLFPKVFKRKEWGTNTVLRDTIHDLDKVKVSFLEELNDIDVYDDIAENEVFEPFLIKSTV